MVNPYSVLGISPSASVDEITAAYRTLAHAAHPDRNGGAAEATARMVALNAAYDALKTNEGRARVDAALAAETPPAADADKLAAELFVYCVNVLRHRRQTLSPSGKTVAVLSLVTSGTVLAAPGVATLYNLVSRWRRSTPPPASPTVKAARRRTKRRRSPAP